MRRAHPKFTESQQIPDVSYEDRRQPRPARHCGRRAPPGRSGLGPGSGRRAAVVLDYRTDPSIPPIPPNATFEQAKDAAMALLKGDPDRWAVLREGFLTKAREVLPGKRD